jgi:gamma-glutamyl-gamma-aminobutyraldehyde dehydrogenase
MGAMVSQAHLERVLGYVQKGNRDAELIAGGTATQVDGRGQFMMPTVFRNVPVESAVARDEIFGPVLSVFNFESEEEAIRMANDSFYGLSASIWTESVDRAVRVSRALRAGSVSVNAVDASDITMPFGGYKQSGFGRDCSLHALDKYSHLKSTWINVRAA